MEVMNGKIEIKHVTCAHYNWYSDLKSYKYYFTFIRLVKIIRFTI